MNISNIHRLKYIAISLSMVFGVTSCSQHSRVTYAPHRTQASQMVIAKVVKSYPVRVTKNSGIGALAGGIGGSLLGQNIGSGGGRIAGAAAGQLLGVFTGSNTESRLRETSAQEVTIKIANKNYTLIAKNLPPLQSGQSVMAYTNVYGKPLSIQPLK